MKRIFIAGGFILFVAFVQAQNVGINDPAPTAKLTVKGSEATADGQAAAIKLQNTAPGTTNAWYLRAGATGNNTPNGGFSIADNTGYHFNMGQGGNIGLGIAPSAAKLDVNGTMKIEGLNTLEFGAGVTKETNAGKIGYQTYTPGALDIVGAGTTVANRKVNIFAEGGTTFNGPIKVGGSTGTVGQVLTSNGTAAPTWENAAYSNNIRFSFDFINDANTNDFAVFQATKYNLNPTDVVKNSAGITFNRSGLYHFNLSGNFSLDYPTAPTFLYPTFRIFLYTVGANYSFDMIPRVLMQPNSADNLFWLGVAKESLELYILAPKTIKLEYITGFTGVTPTTFGISGNLTGHLISE